MHTYVFVTFAPKIALSFLSQCIVDFLGAFAEVVGVVGVVGGVAVVAVVGRPTRLHFLGARAFFYR